MKNNDIITIESKQDQDQDQKDNTRVLSNGAVYDMSTHRIVSNPGGGKYAINKQNASAYARRRFELKRQRIIDAANEFVDNLDGKSPGSDDMRFITEVIKAVMQKALNSQDPKQIDAVRFILKESGLSENNNNDVGKRQDDRTSVLEKLGSEVIQYILDRSKR